MICLLWKNVCASCTIHFCVVLLALGRACLDATTVGKLVLCMQLEVAWFQQLLDASNQEILVASMHVCTVCTTHWHGLLPRIGIVGIDMGTKHCHCGLVRVLLRREAYGEGREKQITEAAMHE